METAKAFVYDHGYHFVYSGASVADVIYGMIEKHPISYYSFSRCFCAALSENRRKWSNFVVFRNAKGKCEAGNGLSFRFPWKKRKISKVQCDTPRSVKYAVLDFFSLFFS